MNCAHLFSFFGARAPSRAIYPARHGRNPAARPCPCGGAGGLARPAARLSPAFVSRSRPFAHHPLLPPRQVRGRWGVPARRGRSRPERQGDQEHSPACRPAGLREDGDAAQGTFCECGGAPTRFFCAPRAVLHERARPLTHVFPAFHCIFAARLRQGCRHGALRRREHPPLHDVRVVGRRHPRRLPRHRAAPAVRTRSPGWGARGRKPTAGGGFHWRDSLAHPLTLLSLLPPPPYRALLRRAAQAGALVVVLDATGGAEHDTLAAE
jgi:hypothetical protein